MTERLTGEEEIAVSVKGDCPICDAKDGQRCIGRDGKVLGVGQLHAGRLRMSKAAAAAN